MPQRRDRDKARVLQILKDNGADSAEILHIMWIGLAESDFNNEAKALMQDGTHYTWGIFQMSDRWHGTKDQILDLEYSTKNRLKALRALGKPLGEGTVRNCWEIQRWHPSDPNVPYSEWLKAESTQNYLRRESQIIDVINDPEYFTKKGK